MFSSEVNPSLGRGSLPNRREYLAGSRKRTGASSPFILVPTIRCGTFEVGAESRVNCVHLSSLPIGFIPAAKWIERETGQRRVVEGEGVVAGFSSSSGFRVETFSESVPQHEHSSARPQSGLENCYIMAGI